MSRRPTTGRGAPRRRTRLGQGAETRAATAPTVSKKPEGLQLYDATGARKYVTAEERAAFLAAAERSPRQVRTLCLMLAYSGCRLSEALGLTADRVDLDAGLLIIETLKKRRTGVYRGVPVPAHVLEALDLVHGVRELQRKRGRGRDVRLWPVSRTTAWRRMAEVLDAAGIAGPQSSPKGLRHGFGVQAVSSGVPLNLVQRWLGHAQLSTTAIYADAVGAEERGLMARMWG
ncbi:MAG: tyrosine-type recombinase/integrase [Alphaproteobacteria bacterium]|jgi:integrase|nr:tyrosine-type recombinase/integrase [Alphaproteobacteria bacterium]